MPLRHAPFALAALLLLGGCGRSDAGPGVLPASQRRAVDAVSYLDASGSAHSLAEHRGKVVVVDVWATWCPPCRHALPEVAALQGREGEDFVVLPISVDGQGWEDVRPFLGANPQLGLRAFLPRDARSLDPFGSIRGIPTVFIIDRQGRLRERWSGYHPGRAEQALKAALSEP